MKKNEFRYRDKDGITVGDPCNNAEVADYLLDHAHVATVPGSAFGKGGEGYIRFSYATAYDQIVEAMTRMRKAFAELKEK